MGKFRLVHGVSPRLSIFPRSIEDLNNWRSGLILLSFPLAAFAFPELQRSFEP